MVKLNQDKIKKIRSNYRPDFSPTLNTLYYNRSYFEMDDELKFILTNYFYKVSIYNLAYFSLILHVEKNQ